ncbi:MAG TPA: tetratricopeptide repeat protein [Sedimentisphaerales bacterium]|nr:tetratricopeptide repeat protein [Sedimentisphaerales bacterium]
MLRRLALAVLLLVAALPALAGWKEGDAAYSRRDYATAFREFKPLAEKGDADAQYNLARMFYSGLGVRSNVGEAVKWWRRAAEQGHVKAQFRLGDIFFHGFGVPKNYGEAAKWWRRSAEQGHVDAQSGLGMLYEAGRGVPRNSVLAYMWTSLSAAQGNAVAEVVLDAMEKRMTPADVSKAQEMAAKWRPKKAKR